jgi:hypothetical protein
MFAGKSIGPVIDYIAFGQEILQRGALNFQRLTARLSLRQPATAGSRLLFTRNHACPVSRLPSPISKQSHSPHRLDPLSSAPSVC